MTAPPPSPAQAAIDRVNRLLQRSARDAARFIRPRAFLGRGQKSRRRDWVRQRPPASARAVGDLGFWRATTAGVAVHIGRRRQRQRNAHAHCAGRTAERLRRPIRHGALSRQVRLRRMSKLMCVFRQSGSNGLGLFSPPYGVLFLAGGLG